MNFQSIDIPIPGIVRLSLTGDPTLMLKLDANSELNVMQSVAFSLSGTETSPSSPIISSKIIL